VLPRLIPGFLLLVATCAAACGGSGNGGDNASGQGSLIIARGDAILELALESGDMRTLVSAGDPGEFLLDPALSPDGRRIAYVLQPPPRIVEQRYDAGSDIWIADRDGAGPRAIFVHTQPNQLVRWPRWLDDRTVLAVVQEFDEVAGRQQVAYTLQRIDVDTGARMRVTDNVLAFDISPDGARVAFAQVESQTGQSLQSIAVDGSDRRTLVPVTENLSPFNYPRYSPDGGSIAFAAADQTLAPQVLPTAAPGGVLSAPPPNGLPEDVWVVPPDGGRPRLVASLQEDVPGLTWSGDGEHIYVLGVIALYDVDVRTGSVTQIGEGAFHGQVEWAP
jgi:Tol biopolymer transport system component